MYPRDLPENAQWRSFDVVVLLMTFGEVLAATTGLALRLCARRYREMDYSRTG